MNNILSKEQIDVFIKTYCATLTGLFAADKNNTLSVHDAIDWAAKTAMFTVERLTDQIGLLSARQMIENLKNVERSNNPDYPNVTTR